MCGKKDCKIIVKGPSGEECELVIRECHEEEDGSCVIVARCDSDKSECCCCRKE